VLLERLLRVQNGVLPLLHLTRVQVANLFAPGFQVVELLLLNLLGTLLDARMLNFCCGFVLPVGQTGYVEVFVEFLLGVVED